MIRQDHDQVAVVPLHSRHFSPGDAQVNRTGEFQPLGNHPELTVLVRSPPPAARRRLEVALHLWCRANLHPA
jgi:hypothetical protein